MLVSKQFFLNLSDEASRVGYGQAIERIIYFTLNRYFCARRLNVIHLTREFLTPLAAGKYDFVTSRLATESDLLEMRAEGKWDMSDELLDAFRAGASCLLSYVHGRLAGYTWVQVSGCPKLLRGLNISVPEGYGYNFGGFTLPEFRGYGLQPYRHHEVMSRTEWSHLKGMIGYVEAVNFSSQRGQAKSGYQPLGTIILLGTKSRFAAIFSAPLRRLGLRRADG